jgi:hypothetical protein
VDLKKLFSGVGLAAVAGLLFGGAMKPNLRGDERPEGPQIFTGWSGARSTGPFDDGLTLAYWQGQIPDYVVGTDWKQQIAWREEPDVIEAVPYTDYIASDEEAPEPVQYAMTRWDEPPPEPVQFPSLAGGAAYGPERLDAPPPPPSDEYDAEAMPEATGDTRPVDG